MNSKSKLMIAFAGVALASAAVAGGAAWWLATPKAAAPAGAASRKIDVAKKPSRYVTLDKVIVMLRRGPHDTEAHYLSADLVLATNDEKEKHTKEHLPLLRSIAVSALSGYTLADASNMTVEQYAAHLN